jgi:hypothetical protein
MVRYLTSIDWITYFVILGSRYRTGTRVGVTWLPRYSESWANLFDVFGALVILESADIKKIPVDSRDLPPDMVSPIAMTLECAILLAGLAGCERKTVHNGLPRLEGTGISLSFEKGQRFIIGTYTQNGDCPPYMNYGGRLVAFGTLIASGTLQYRERETVSLTDCRQRGQQKDSTLSDLRQNHCKCSFSVDLSLEDWTQTMSSVLTLLTSDSPIYIRVSAAIDWKIPDAVKVLAQKCTFWKNISTPIIPKLKRELGNLISNSKVVPVPRAEAINMPFCFQQMEPRHRDMVKSGIKFVNLGWSWLSDPSFYQEPSESSEEGRTFVRPDWPFALATKDLVIFEEVLLSCERYLNGTLPNNTTDYAGQAFLRTGIACQLQEVDWYLTNNLKAQAACETQIILHELGNNLPEAESNQQRAASSPDWNTSTEREGVRILLGYRALLIAMLFHLALDYSDFMHDGVGSTGSQTVLFR